MHARARLFARLPPWAGLFLLAAACAGTPDIAPSATTAPPTPASLQASGPPSAPLPVSSAQASPVEPSPAPVAWQEIEQPVGLPSGSVSELVPDGDGFLAVVGGWRGPALLFSSSDGATWERRVVDRSRDAWTVDVAVGPKRLVAVGGHNDFAAGDARLVDVCEREDPNARGAIWWSDDGAAWTPTGSARSLRGYPIGHVAALGTGFVAVGSWNVGERGGSSSWVSKDGRRWDRAAASEALLAGSMADLAVGGGSIVAVGGSECTDETALAWHSTDGRSWDVVELEPASRATTVAYGPAGFLAVGWVAFGDDPAIGWLSDDGDDWTRVDLPAPASTDGIRDLVGLPDRYLIVSDNGEILSSADGRTWVPAMARVGVGAPTQVAAGDDLAVAMGHGWGEDESVMVWTAPADALP